MASGESKPWGERVRAVFNVSDPARLRLGRRGSIVFLISGCLLIGFWQGIYIENRGDLDRTYRRHTGQGIYQKRAQGYFYFLYYTGKFPITTGRSAASLIWNGEAARAALRGGSRDKVWDRTKAPPDAGPAARRLRHPRLKMEDYAYLRTGDLAKIFLLYPHAWYYGTPKRAKLIAFNRLLGVASLLALFISFSLLGHRVFGSALVALLGSNPYQLIELYLRNNVFGYPIAVASLMLALHAPIILAKRPSRMVYLLPLVSGAFLASVREVRTEPALIVLSVAALYVFAPGAWRRRLILLGTLALSYAASAQLWHQYWEYKFEEAHAIVSRQGGVTFDGRWNHHHAVWHSIWCGLGDFSRSRGYFYSDRAAYRYGIPEVNRRYGTHYRLSPRSRLLRTRDESGKHRIKPETLEEYSTVLRDKILGDIWEDPIWYLSVLARRTIRVFTVTTPVRLGFGAQHVDIPFSAWLFLPALLGLVTLRLWDQALLLAFYLPTSLTAILVYSGGGVALHSAFHLVLFALVVSWTVNLLARAPPPRSWPFAREARRTRPA